MFLTQGLNPDLLHRRQSPALEVDALLVESFPGGSDTKESACNVEDLGSIPGLGRFPWRRESLPTPVFWPGELDTTEQLSLIHIKLLKR